MSLITADLFALQDIDYKKFHSKLMPGVNEEVIIGVRVPELRKYAKQFSKNEKANEFINSLPHKYYEENNVHAFIIETINDFDIVIAKLEQFLPYIDNWATCDMLRPKIFKNNTNRLMPYIKKWMKSPHAYTVRYSIGLLNSFYLDEGCCEDILDMVCEVKSKDYYVNMMIAWFFATALAKQYDLAIKYIENKKLSIWVHNKAIQKAIESRRITPEIKKYLRTLKQR